MLHIENCIISGFYVGIDFAAPGQLFVKDTISRNNIYYGIYITPYPGLATVSIDHCRMEKNGTGLFAAFNAKVTVRDSVAAGNNTTPIPAIAGDGFEGSDLTIENCVATGNNNGIHIGSIGRVSNTIVTDNTNVGLFNDGGTLISFGNNRVRGNGVDKSGPITIVPQS